MEVEVDFVDHHNSLIIDQLFAGRACHRDMIKQVSYPAEPGAITIGKRREGHFETMPAEQIFSAFDLSGKAVMSRPHEPVNEVANLHEAPFIRLAQTGKPCGQRNQCRVFVEEALGTL